MTSRPAYYVFRKRKLDDTYLWENYSFFFFFQVKIWVTFFYVHTWSRSGRCFYGNREIASIHYVGRGNRRTEEFGSDPTLYVFFVYHGQITWNWVWFQLRLGCDGNPRPRCCRRKQIYKLNWDEEKMIVVIQYNGKKMKLKEPIFFLKISILVNCNGKSHLKKMIS